MSTSKEEMAEELDQLETGSNQQSLGKYVSPGSSLLPYAFLFLYAFQLLLLLLSNESK